MKNLFTTNIGRLRLLGFLEGTSLLVLVFIAVPLKYFNDDPYLVKALGPIHGGLFLLFVVNSVSIGIQERWKFWQTTWKVVLSCLVPFGTFYVDFTILSKLYRNRVAKGIGVLILLLTQAGCSGPDTAHYIKNNMDFPKTLSSFKLFDGTMARLQPAANVQLLQLSSTLFTDYTEKQRLLVLPPGTQLIADGDKLPTFPDGALLAKTFYYSGKQTEGSQRIIETRILKKHNGLWNVATYLWNEEQNEAYLTYDGATVPVTITDPSGERKDIDYKVPSAQDCFTCHKNIKELTPLGPKLRNLNRDIYLDGSSMSQLEYLQKKGILQIPQHAAIAKLPAYKDASLPIAQRARAYFEVNCAHCHNPAGFAGGYSLNLNYETNFKETGITLNKVNINHRMTVLDMPKLGTTQVDQEGLKIVQQYLSTLTATNSN